MEAKMFEFKQSFLSLCALVVAVIGYDTIEVWHEHRMQAASVERPLIPSLQYPGSKYLGCSMDGDVNITYSPSFVRHLFFCMKMSFNYVYSPLVLARVRDCLVDAEYGYGRRLTVSCAQCYAEYKLCEDMKCGSECLEGTCSPRCHACRAHFCNIRFSRCTKLTKPAYACSDLDAVYEHPAGGMIVPLSFYLSGRPTQEVLDNDPDLLRQHQLWGCSQARDLRVLFNTNFYRQLDLCSFSSEMLPWKTRLPVGVTERQARRQFENRFLGSRWKWEEAEALTRGDIQQCFKRELSTPCANCYADWAMCIRTECAVECLASCSQGEEFQGLCNAEPEFLRSGFALGWPSGFRRTACALCVERLAESSSCYVSLQSCSWLRGPPARGELRFSPRQLSAAVSAIHFAKNALYGGETILQWSHEGTALLLMNRVDQAKGSDQEKQGAIEGQLRPFAATANLSEVAQPGSPVVSQCADLVESQCKRLKYKLFSQLLHPRFSKSIPPAVQQPLSNGVGPDFSNVRPIVSDVPPPLSRTSKNKIEEHQMQMKEIAKWELELNGVINPAPERVQAKLRHDSGDAYLFNMRPNVETAADSSLGALYRDFSWISFREHLQWLALVASFLIGAAVLMCSYFYKPAAQRHKLQSKVD